MFYSKYRGVHESGYPVKAKIQIGLVKIIVSVLMMYIIKDSIFFKIFQIIGLHDYYASKLAFIVFYFMFFAFSFHVYRHNANKYFSNGFLSLKCSLTTQITALSVCMVCLEISLLGIQSVFFRFFEIEWWTFSVKENIFYANSKLGSLANGYLSLPTALFILTQVFLGPIYEEILFRGFIQRRISKKIGSLLAVIFTSLLFALLHSEKQMFAVFINSLIIGFVFIKTNNLLYPIILHSIGNFLTWLFEGFGLLIFFTSKDPESLSNISTWQTEIVLFLIFTPIIIIILGKIARYNKHQDRLES